MCDVFLCELCALWNVCVVSGVCLFELCELWSGRCEGCVLLSVAVKTV